MKTNLNMHSEGNAKLSVPPRAGLDFASAEKIAKILYDISDASAVVITDTKIVLAYVGFVCKKHPKVGMPITTIATREVLETGAARTVTDRQSLYQCNGQECGCEIESGIVAPLTINGEIIGTVKLYHAHKGDPPNHILKMAEGAAQLLSMQVELAEKEVQKQFIMEARLDALRAKINPHFFFNAINTIGMLIRTNPEQARELLLDFSTIFRNSLNATGHFIPLSQEVDNTLNYLKIEKARFGEKLTIQQEISPSVSDCLIPVLSIQPLAENSVIHGIAPKEGNGTVQLIARLYDTDHIEIVVRDNGVGIKPEILPHVAEQSFSSGSGFGVGLYNVNQRLRLLYGDECGLVIRSDPNDWTTVSFKVPLYLRNEEGYPI